MEHITEYFIGAAMIAIPIVAKVFFTEYINSLAKQFFKSKKKADTFISWTLIVFALAGILLIAFTYSQNKTQTTIVHLPQKTDTEVLVDAASKGLTKVFEKAPEWHKQDQERKMERERIFQEGRKQMWVYKIGASNANKKSLLELRERILKIHPSNIYVFKEGKKSFFLFKSEGNATKEMLVASQDNFKATIDTIESTVEVVDLMNECSKKETVIQDVDFIKDKKNKVEVGCWACNK